MKKFSFVIAAIAAMALAVPAFAAEVKVSDPTPTGTFTDEYGNQGYVEVDTDEQVVRACNENQNTPAGDDFTGYIWISVNGESTTPSYGNANIGAGDADGESDEDDPEGDTDENDCPGNTGEPPAPPAQ